VTGGHLGFSDADDAEGNSADEELSEPARKQAPFRWLGRSVSVGLAVTLALLVVWRVEAGQYSHHPRTTANRTHLPTAPAEPDTNPPSGTVTASPSRPALPVRHDTNPATCPELRCRSTSVLPAATLAALRHALKGERVVREQTVQLVSHAGLLWYRSVIVRAQHARLHLTIEASTSAQRKSSAAGITETTSVQTGATLSEAVRLNDLVVLIFVTGHADQTTTDAVDSLIGNPAILDV
jgi:cytoskeletal protein RodZ